MFKDKFKAVNSETIRVVALELMKENKTTSTLEIKRILRDMGFWAIQSEVSEQMKEIAAQEEWHFTCNGTYRTYFLNEEMQYLFQNFTQKDMDAFLSFSWFSEN